MILPRSLPLVIIYAISLHLVWAAALLIDSEAGNATAVNTLLYFVSNSHAVVIYFMVAILAITGSSYKGILKPLCMLPQQLIMMISAGGSLLAMWNGQFADGVQRSHAFLIADQSPAVIAAVLHTYAILLIARNEIT